MEYVDVFLCDAGHGGVLTGGAGDHIIIISPEIVDTGHVTAGMDQKKPECTVHDEGLVFQVWIRWERLIFPHTEAQVLIYTGKSAEFMQVLHAEIFKIEQYYGKP